MWSHPVGDGFAWVAWSVVTAASAVAAVLDLRSRRIPNSLTLPMIAGGVLCCAVLGGTPAAEQSLLGLLVLGFPFVLLWMLGGGGAGDAKLMMAIGSWLGVRHGIVALLGVALAGGVLSAGAAIARRRMGSTLVNMAGIGIGLLDLLRGPGGMGEKRQVLLQPSSHRVPYGIAILAGVCGAVVWMAIWTR